MVSAGIVVRPRDCGGAVRHVHLAVGPDPATSMTVSFASIPSHYPQVPVAAVAIGTKPTDLHVMVIADQAPSAYNVSVTHVRTANGPPNDGTGQAQYWSPYYHHVTITNLQPNTTYYYQPLIAGSRKDLTRARPNLRQSTNGAYDYSPQQQAQTAMEMEPDEVEGDDEALYPDNQRRRRLAPAPYDGSEHACPAMDKIRSFSTAAAKASPTRLAIVGDLGQFAHSQETLQSLFQINPHELDAMILAGDIAYAGTDGRKWDTFFDFWDDTRLAERIPVSLMLLRVKYVKM